MHVNNTVTLWRNGNTGACRRVYLARKDGRVSRGFHDGANPSHIHRNARITGDSIRWVEHRWHKVIHVDVDWISARYQS